MRLIDIWQEKKKKKSLTVFVLQVKTAHDGTQLKCKARIFSHTCHTNAHKSLQCRHSCSVKPFAILPIGHQSDFEPFCILIGRHVSEWQVNTQWGRTKCFISIQSEHKNRRSAVTGTHLERAALHRLRHDANTQALTQTYTRTNECS